MGRKRNAVQHGLYSARFSEAELVLLRELSKREDLDEEVGLLRLAIRLVAASLDLTPEAALEALGLGVARLGQVVRVQRVLSGRASDSLAAAFAVALREIGEELGVGAA